MAVNGKGKGAHAAMNVAMGDLHQGVGDGSILKARLPQAWVGKRTAPAGNHFCLVVNKELVATAPDRL